jgi:hypothetical protein
MTWVAWRQHRQEAFVAAAVLMLVSAYLLLTGLSMYRTADEWQLFVCRFGGSEVTSACTLGMSDFQSKFLDLSWMSGALLTVLPAIVSVFVGAPLLAREVEQRTHVLAWSQSVTKIEWFRTKVGLVAAAALLASSLLAALSTWWHRPMDLAFILEGPWHFFSVTGVVPIAYTVFGLSLGWAAGALVKRTIAAMGLALVLFVGARAAVQFLRPSFAVPLIKELNFVDPAYPNDVLVVNAGWLDASGHAVSYNDVSVILQQGFPGIVARSGPSPLTPAQATAINEYLQGQGLHYVFAYQPIERFWSFQAIEASIFLVLALTLVAFTVWWLVTRIHAR